MTVQANDAMRVCDSDTGYSWRRWTGAVARDLDPSIFCTLDPVLDDGELLFGSGNEGKVFQLEYGSADNGEATTGRWKSGILTLDEPETIKIFRYLHLKVDSMSGPLTIDWEVDNGRASGSMQVNFSGSQTWGAPSLWNDAAGTVQGGMYWTSSANIRKDALTLSFPQSAVGRVIQLSIYESSSTTAFEIVGYEIMWKPKRQLYPRGD